MMVCNKDCFNCKFEDCIWDDKVTTQAERDYQKAYYVKNSPKIIARVKKWQEEHPERVREISRKANHNYYMRNKEERKQYFKQYYLERKAQKLALHDSSSN